MTVRNRMTIQQPFDKIMNNFYLVNEPRMMFKQAKRYNKTIISYNKHQQRNGYIIR